VGISLNSKFEIRMTNQIRNSNDETVVVSNFGPSNLIRHSNFEFRVFITP